MNSFVSPRVFVRISNLLAVGCCSAFLLLYFLMPYRLYPLGFGVYLLPLALGVLFSVNCLERFRLSELLAFLVFFGIASVACFVAPSPPVWISLAPWLSSLAMYLVCRNAFSDIPFQTVDVAVKVILSLFIAAAFAQVLIGDIGYVSSWTGHPIVTRYATGLDAVTNHAAVLALPLVLWTLALALDEPNTQRSVLWMLGCAAIYFTLSRAGGLALLIAVAVLGIRMRNDPEQLGRLGKHVVLGIAAVVMAWALPTRLDCYEFGGDCSAGRWELSDYSAATRAATFKVAGLAIREYPLTGLGVGRFPEYYLSHRGELDLDLERIDPRVRITPHNSYIELAAEFGLPALIAFLVLIAVLLRNAARNSSPAGRSIFSACIGLLSWMFFHDGFSDHLLWTMLGCAVALGEGEFQFFRLGKV